MVVCPKCARSIDDTRFAASCDACPGCGANMQTEEAQPWIDVARVANLAEAGFLTDELVGHGIDAQVHQLQDFNALTDRWASTYLIRVPASALRDAAAHIRQHVVDDGAEIDAGPAESRLSSENHVIDPLLWRPVALVLLAGVSSFVLGQRFSDRHDQKADRRPPRNSLSSAMESIEQPFVVKPAAGQAGHRLQFDGHRQSWLLDTDRDGDGQYDSRQAFHASGAAW
jgi:hypothetical protein